MSDRATAIRNEILALFGELEKLAPNHCLLQYRGMFDGTQSASEEAIELFNAHFFYPTPKNAFVMLENLRDTLRANVSAFRTPPNLRPVPTGTED